MNPSSFIFVDILTSVHTHRNLVSLYDKGVSVAYCPENGVTRNIWDSGLEAFPKSDGTIIAGDGLFY